MKFKQTNYTNSIVSIVAFPDHYVNRTVTVAADGVTADTDGKKIVKAGTVYPANDATAQGILFYDTDVTYGDAGGALLVHGFVDYAKYKALGLPEIAATAKAAMPQITFIGYTAPTEG